MPSFLTSGVFNTRNYSAFGISLTIHALFLLILALFKLTVIDQQEQLIVESILPEERVQEEFVKELEDSTEIATTFNTVSGGMVSTTVGQQSKQVVNQQRIETSETLKDPKIQVNVGEISIPGTSLLGEDLGEAEVAGETGAMVEGYGAALSRVAQELIRLMRENRVLVIWLFDESDSMTDDRREIRDELHKVYEELDLVQKNDTKFKGNKETLVTAILSYGDQIHELTKKPTASIDEVKQAIDSVPTDESGKENMCQSIQAAIRKYRAFASGRTKRKMVCILVSDESGDDGDKIEFAIQEAKRAKAPVYILGRESNFGHPTARIRWKDPVYGLTHWLPITRGPETAFVECLQWDGLHGRWDAFSSGFGPYNQVRIAKETGGIFFVLPGEEENLTGAGAKERRVFKALDLKEYEPLLLPRAQYQKERQSNAFRRTIWEVIQTLNPYENKQLSIREHWYPLSPAEFQQTGREQFSKAVYALRLLDEQVPRLENIQKLRDKESSQRWRANFDLLYAQCLAYKVRLFQFLLAMDAHAKNPPKITKPNTNRWNLSRRKAMLPPDDEQVRLTKVNLDQLNEFEQLARKKFQEVIEDHPRTPYARRAQYELSQGFGFAFVEAHRDPNYDKGIKLPKQ